MSDSANVPENKSANVHNGKPAVKKAGFLAALNKAAAVSEQPPEAPQAAPLAPPASTPKGRAGQKHIGAYFEKGDPILEQLAILRTRLEMTNSQLIEHALKELWARHEAGRKFGD